MFDTEAVEPVCQNAYSFPTPMTDTACLFLDPLTAYLTLRKSTIADNTDDTRDAEPYADEFSVRSDSIVRNQSFAEITPYTQHIWLEIGRDRDTNVAIAVWKVLPQTGPPTRSQVLSGVERCTLR